MPAGSINGFAARGSFFDRFGRPAVASPCRQLRLDLLDRNGSGLFGLLIGQRFQDPASDRTGAADSEILPEPMISLCSQQAAGKGIGMR